MGRSYHYECTKCQYVARVSGGEDRGANCFSRTMRCLDCQELFDAVTHVRGTVVDRTTRLRAAGSLGWWGEAPARQRNLPVHLAFSSRVAKTPANVAHRLLPAGGAAHWFEAQLQCPIRGSHRLTAWQHPGPCPRCGTVLDRLVVPYRLWD